MENKTSKVRFKVKEIICENPQNLVTNITLYNRDGSVLGTAPQGFLCHGDNKEFISFTFTENMYLEHRNGIYYLVIDK